jgi:regulator of protease activity HflC (stomatin/prohibitin superfamily)
MLGLLLTPLLVVLGFAILVIVGGFRMVNQYERGIVLTFGKYSNTREPGLTWIFTPFNIQRMIRVDIRIKAVDVPDQEAITKDNISVRINAVIYYKVVSSEKAVLEVENFTSAVSQLAQTTMRNASGEVDLDQLLSQRDEISQRIQTVIDKSAVSWGIEVLNVELKDIQLPEEMKRTIAKQAEAEREKRAVIIQSEGEVIASENMAKAATVLSSAPGALHLRTLQSINDISSDASNTIVFALPIEVLRAVESVGNMMKK